MVMFLQKNHRSWSHMSQCLWQASRHGGIIRPKPEPVVRMRGAPDGVRILFTDLWLAEIQGWWINYLSLMMRRNLIFCVGLKELCIIFQSWKKRHDGLLWLCRPVFTTEWAIKLFFWRQFSWTAVAVFGFDNAPDTRKELRCTLSSNMHWKTWGATRFLSCIQWSHNSWSIQRNEGYPRGMRLQRKPIYKLSVWPSNAKTWELVAVLSDFLQWARFNCC